MWLPRPHTPGHLCHVNLSFDRPGYLSPIRGAGNFVLVILMLSGSSVDVRFLKR